MRARPFSAAPCSVQTVQRKVCGHKQRRDRTCETIVRSGPDADKPSAPANGVPLDEELLKKLREAQEETAKLKAELAAAQAAAGPNAPQQEAPRTPAKRIDGADLRRETMFTTNSPQRNWLSEAELDFITGGGPSEAETTEGLSSEQQTVIQRRLLIGFGLTAAAVAFALVPTQSLRRPTKPLFFYLVPLLRVQSLLQEAETFARDADWQQLQILITRVKGQPNNIRDNLYDAVASLERKDQDPAEQKAIEIVEFVNDIDFNKYYESLGKPASLSGKEQQRFVDFSLGAIKAAQKSLKEFLALMPRDQLEAAKTQLNSF